MGRPPKYETDEERKSAKRVQSNASSKRTMHRRCRVYDRKNGYAAQKAHDRTTGYAAQKRYREKSRLRIASNGGRPLPSGAEDADDDGDGVALDEEDDNVTRLEPPQGRGRNRR
jgi:hypothetical protein